MCGIAGILSPSESDNHHVAERMAQALSHRGPDALECWSDPGAGVALAHTRLSIIDLSANGAQPMISHYRRYILSYNGEIYNYRNIRNTLEEDGTIEWRGHSDTEVLLAAIEKWGVEKALESANGMFAFALWDRESRQLTLARDRMGEKPLYVGWVNGNIVFSSELKPLSCLPGWSGNIDRRALGYLLRFGYVPAPLSIYEGIYKLPHAHFVTLNTKNSGQAPDVESFRRSCRKYWNLPEVAAIAAKSSGITDASHALERLDELLTESVRNRIVADVPVGSLLSGGIDSSLVTAVMQRVSAGRIRTFTIGFAEDDFDEAKYAKPVASHIGSEHTEIILSHKDALDLIPELPEVYDEPFADASQIPTLLVSAAARKDVTVALSGDGGDELFSGYARYWAGLRIWPFIKWLPSAVRLKSGKLLSTRGKAILQSLSIAKSTLTAYKIWRLGRRITAADFESYYSNLLALSHCRTSVLHWPAGLPLSRHAREAAAGMGIEQRMMLTDQCSYLPDNILVKTDRASMAVSLELRTPFLDHKLVEFAWTLPSNLRRRGKNGKFLLRQLLYRYVPPELVERPKKGFDVPQDKWLRGPLREWMLDLLAPAAVLGSGYMDNTVVQRLIKEHLAGEGEHGYALWPVLMFQAWLEKQ